MNNKIAIKLLTLAVACAAIPGTRGILAAERSASPPRSELRANPQTDSLKRSAQWENHGTAYALVPEVRAVMSAGKDEAPAAALARKGVTDGKVVERKGGFVLYKDSAAPKTLSGSAMPAALLAAKTEPRPVVLNLRTRQLAVVLNSIRVELKDPTGAQALATEMGLTLGKQFPNRPVAYYAVPAGMDLIALVNRMRADTRVAKADMELIEHVRTPH